MKQLFVALMLGCAAAQAEMVCLEAEQFADRGGWAIDSQFMDQMGSTFLLAHGMGAPVADAKTTVTLAQGGAYDVWAYTRNWTAPWSEHAAGTFEIRICDGEGAAATSVWRSGVLGTGTGEWRWQKAGTVTLKAGKASLALHDLTGFDGRCDAVCLATPGTIPPARDPRQSNNRPIDQSNNRTIPPSPPTSSSAAAASRAPARRSRRRGSD